MTTIEAAHLLWCSLVLLGVSAVLTGASAHTYLRARRLLLRAQRYEDRAHATLRRAVEMLPRQRRAPHPESPDAGP